MPTTDADAILELAASTTLPPDTTHYEIGSAAPGPQPFARFEALFAASATLSTVDGPKQTKRKARSKRTSNFTVFVDPLTPTEGTAATEPALKRSKTAPRIALSTRSVASTNSTPTPSPRTPDTPFPFSFEDPLWENAENYEPQPSTPIPLSSFGMSAANRPFVTTPLAGPPPRRSARGLRAHRPNLLIPHSPRLPRNMELYTMLGLSNFDADSEEIRAAYRRAAFEQHPDRASEEDRGEATLRMQQLNAARDLLLNEDSRRQYHIDGQVPWVDIV